VRCGGAHREARATRGESRAWREARGARVGHARHETASVRGARRGGRRVRPVRLDGCSVESIAELCFDDHVPRCYILVIIYCKELIYDNIVSNITNKLVAIKNIPLGTCPCTFEN
jgi:hypothetical protein